uniref:NADH-ubiquinone oxidoreductase chain 6 n=1 Tax=Rhaphidophora quadrispina TaxID=2982643 RepID=A0A977T605_9ORTH|nr:NADH dehydrogenase subunit 6 [Rhaphidophora quadrispina]UXP34383.1 NADH dehydrogenase subunit 6 [Rhaphidophora quadrispina]
MQTLNILLLSMMNNSIFTLINHPLAMMIVIIIQTMLICLMTGIISQTFWFSYILFLVFLGGMLVLFIYITSLASNEMFKMPSKILIIMMITLMTMLSIMMIMDSSITNMMMTSIDMNTINNKMTIMYSESNLSLMKLYNNPTNIITLMLVLYLFLTLIVIVKITNIFQGPLRQKN